MRSSQSSGSGSLEDKVFMALVIAVSLAFAGILWPFFGAVLWGFVIALLFAPLARRLANAMRQRRALAALLTVAIIIVIVILPLILIGVSLVDQATGVYKKIQSGELNFNNYFQQVFNSLPGWAANLADRFDLTNLRALQDKLAGALTRGSQFLVEQAVNIGQNTVSFFISLFVMLYTLFFLLRDGDKLSQQIMEVIPLRMEQKKALLDRLTVVIRATVKGNLVVALLQGASGGLIFWLLGIHAPLLWAALMALLALLPAVGAALVWLPVTVYLLATGSIIKGIILLAYGTLVISLIDNIVRPFLVGKDTQMPDYVVLVSTLGGIAVFGVNGFVIGPVVAAMFIAVWDIFSKAQGSPKTR